MNKKLFTLIITSFTLLLTIAGNAQVKVPRLISDGMILQRDHKIKIWGWAAPSERVTILFNNKSYETKCNGDKRWEIKLPAMPAGGPYTMTIKASNELIIKDILIGDVWLCSGQSNMAFTMSRTKDKYASVIAESSNPNIRQFSVKGVWGFSPKNDVQTNGWQAAGPQTLPQFSAVAYFFAKSLFAKYNVPVGIINTSYGGSAAEAWLSDDVIQTMPQYAAKANYFKDPANVKAVTEADKKMISDWFALAKQNDEGSKNDNWAAPGVDTTTWNNIAVPGYWEKKQPGNIDGVVWYRKEVFVSEENAGKDAKLILGYIDDRDSTYFNGQLIGNTNDKTTSRSYVVPGKLIKSGINIITVRIVDTDGSGGFDPSKKYELVTGKTTISLAGTWKYKIGAVIKALPVAKITKFYLQPNSLYNTMINPLLGYTIKGFVWYQGESNTQAPAAYKTLLPALIKSWRREWGQGTLPFIYVQLPNYGRPDTLPAKSTWSEVREAQTMALKLPKTGMATTLDLGEAYDIHPLNKKDVGERLALVANHVVYGDKSIEYSGPIFKSMTVSGNKIIISFDHVGSGLVSKGGRPLQQFAIAGDDKKYVWAKAEIDHDKVIVWNDSIPAPVSIRYAWANNPNGANLYNKENLPASTFRTDKFDIQ